MIPPGRAPTPAVRVVEGGSGPPLVWLHGLRPPTPDDPLLLALAGRFAVRAPVMPGQEGLEALDALPALHDLLLAYDSLLDALQPGPVVLAGHAFGGLLAAELAALRPDRCAALVLASPLGLWNDDRPVEDLFARPYTEVDELIWRGCAARPAVAEGADVEAYVAQANFLGAIAKYAWPIPDKGLRGRLYRIAAPALLVFAEDDAFVPPAYAQDFAAGLAQSRTRLLPGGHMAPYERPDELAHAIADFAPQGQ